MIWLLLAACGGFESEPIAREIPVAEAGPPVAGMAEAALDFPMGAPMGGYSARCRCLGGSGKIDDRDTWYRESFSPTAGVHTRARGQALWLENGQEDLVLVKADLIYVPDHLVTDLADRLGAATGRDMDGKVVIAASHTHHAPANWHKGVTWFLGGDRFHEEVYLRLLGSLEALALEAYDTRVPAAIGVGKARDWDPDDLVYSDRRGENNDFPFFDDVPVGAYKDPTLTVLRVDTAEGDPIGFFFAFGIHGTLGGEDNALVTTDAPGALEYALEDRFDQPLVIAHLQAGGGDASPRGRDSGWARFETVGELAADAILELYEATPVSSDPITLETVTHAVDTDRDNIRVTRDGTVDWSYPPYDEEYEPDDIVWIDETTLDPAFDEFNTQYGGAFCGDDDPLIPGAGVGSEAFPYSSCVAVDTISLVLGAFFDLEPEDVHLPLPESQRAQVAASRIGPLSIRDEDGSTVSDDVLFAFFPGETTAVYTEWFRRRAAAELGFEHAVPIGYAQDHEGYLLTPEDWLHGGYEPNINIWGPLQAEHIMEGVLSMGEGWLLTEELEPQDFSGEYLPTDYPLESELLPQELDLGLAPGTAASSVPDAFWFPIEGLEPAVQPPIEVPRVQGFAQLMWEGGDPAVDLPEVWLERQEGSDWVPVETPSGRLVSDARPDILTVHLPDPLYPAEETQTHTWWAVWQAVGSGDARVAVPEGTYRLRVAGQTAASSSGSWPYDTEPYEVTSEPFEVVPAEITVNLAEGVLSAWIDGPAAGYRLVDLDGSSTGANPLDDGTVTWTLDDGSTIDDSPSWELRDGAVHAEVEVPEGAVSVTVTDPYGNAGTWAL